MPSATIASARQARDTSPAACCSSGLTCPAEFSTTRAPKAHRNQGTSGARGAGGLAPSAACAWARAAAKDSDTASTTRPSRATRHSLTTVARLPVSAPSVRPAPTACATSWMLPPRNSPAWAGLSCRARASSGYSTIDAVDSRVMQTTTVMTSRSALRPPGSTAATASAADAPQMPTAAPASTARARPRPSRGPSHSASSRVLATPTTSHSAACQPSAATCSAVMRAPSSATPRRSRSRAQKSMPGRWRAPRPRWCSTMPKNSA